MSLKQANPFVRDAIYIWAFCAVVGLSVFVVNETTDFGNKYFYDVSEAFDLRIPDVGFDHHLYAATDHFIINTNATDPVLKIYFSPTPSKFIPHGYDGSFEKDSVILVATKDRMDFCITWVHPEAKEKALEEIDSFIESIDTWKMDREQRAEMKRKQEAFEIERILGDKE